VNVSGFGMHVAVAIEPILHRVGAGELVRNGIVVAGDIVGEAWRAVPLLASEEPGRRRCAVGIADTPVRAVELLEGDIAAAVQRLIQAAQPIARQVAECAAGPYPYSSRQPGPPAWLGALKYLVSILPVTSSRLPR
jgi:hypothetical protein